MRDLLLRPAGKGRAPGCPALRSCARHRRGDALPLPTVCPARLSHPGIPGIHDIRCSPPPRTRTPGAPRDRNNHPKVPSVLRQDRPGPTSLQKKRINGPRVRFFGSEFWSTPQRGPGGPWHRPAPVQVSRPSRHLVQSVSRPSEAGALYVGKNTRKVPPPPKEDPQGPA
jgi:hypothetical protein